MQNQNMFSVMRANMVEGQLRPNKVSSHKVLARFAEIAREDFVAPEATANAYLDQPATMGGEPGSERTMAEPMAIARMVQELEPETGDSILVLAGGSGYSTAVLAGLVAGVTVTEADAELRAKAIKLLKGYDNVEMIAADPATYVPATGKVFDAVLVDAPFTQLPNLAGLAAHVKEGGKLVGVKVNASTGVATVVLMVRHGKTFVESELFDTKGTPLAAFSAPEAFVF